MQSRKSFKRAGLTIYLFFLLYLALALTEKQILRKGYLPFSLPIKLDAIETLGVFLISAGLIAGVLLVLNNPRTVNIIISAALLLGTLFLNLFLFRFFYPPFVTTPTGSLETLGEKRWTHDYPFEVLSSAYEQYYLKTVSVNPEIENFNELERVVRFGINLKISRQVPAALSTEQLKSITQNLGDEYLEISKDGLSYRLYPAEGTDQLLLTRTAETVFFVPLDLFEQ